MNLSNPFAPEKKEDFKEADKSLSVAGERARKCLEYTEFKAYREQYERAEKQMLDALLEYTEKFIRGESGDLSNYSITVIRQFTKIKITRSLLENITSDAKKGLRKKDE